MVKVIEFECDNCGEMVDLVHHNHVGDLIICSDCCKKMYVDLKRLI